MVQYRSALTSCGRLLSKSLYLTWVKIIKLVHPLFVLIRRFEGFALLTRQPFVMEWASIRSHKNTWRPVNTLLDYKRSLQGSKLAELLIRSLLPSYNGVNKCFLKFQSKKVLTRARLIQWERFWGWAEKRLFPCTYYKLPLYKPFTLLGDSLSHLLVCFRLRDYTAAPHLIQSFVDVIKCLKAHQFPL